MTDDRPSSDDAGSTPDDPPALQRLTTLTSTPSARRSPDAAPPPMGYQPGLDGIRAVSVIIVILYHAGFSWMHGGFFGVEVFFVVSGFLITSLLLDERSSTGGVSLQQFWIRRARRLLPALFTMLLAVSLWAAFFGDEHLDQLGKDMLPSIFYVSNWAQIFGDVPYFAAADPPLLRHLWSLAVEEQWYLIWPLVFVGLWRLAARRPGGGSGRLAVGLLVASLASMLFSVVLTVSDSLTLTVLLWEPLRYNFLYLNTFSRASGLLLGAAFAFFWRPWRWSRAAQVERRGLDVVGLGAMALVVVISATRAADVLVSASMYRLWLPLVTVLSMLVVAVVVHPGARLTRQVFGWTPLVEVGKRSYGLYLWHWPIFIFADVADDHARFWWAAALTIVVSELCYRFVETPIRKGAIGRMWADLGGGVSGRRSVLAGIVSVALLFLSGTLGLAMVRADPVNIAVDDTEVEFGFDVDAVQPTDTTTGQGDPSVATTDPASAEATAPTTDSSTTTLPELPRDVIIVGDSQAHSLAVNLPEGIEDTFTISNGSKDGCGVLTDGDVRSERTSFGRSFTDCAGFADEWARDASAKGAELALVVLGAWDVFDVEVGGALVPFASAESDRRFLEGLQTGIDALRSVGTHVALLEIACMRPVEAEGAFVPPLPERGDDDRIAHLNGLLRQAVANNPGGDVSFVPGPTQWCNDETIATDLGYRWDGVHVYKPGANLIFTTVAPTLLQIPL